MQANPFVNYLNRYTTFSPEHEAAFDEFIVQLPPPSGKPLRLETRTEQFVTTRIHREFPPSIILRRHTEFCVTVQTRKAWKPDLDRL